MKTKTSNNGWVEIHPNGVRPARTEKEDRERLRYWSKYFNQKNHVVATCKSF